jgi:hypothetical protein
MTMTGWDYYGITMGLLGSPRIRGWCLACLKALGDA